MIPQMTRKEAQSLSKYPDIILEIDQGVQKVLNPDNDYIDFEEVQEIQEVQETDVQVSVSESVGQVLILSGQGLSVCLFAVGQLVLFCVRFMSEVVRFMSVMMSEHFRQRKRARPLHVRKRPVVTVQNNVNVSESGAVVNVQTNINIT